MRVTHLINSMAPSQGGMTTTVNLLSQACSNLKHNVISCDSSLVAQQLDSNLQITACGPGKSRLSWSPNFKNAIVASLTNTDVFAVHGLWQYHNIASNKIFSRYCIPYIVFPHGMLDFWSLKQSRLVKRIAWIIYQKRFIQKSSAICFTTKDEMSASKAVLGKAVQKSCIIPLGTASPPDDVIVLRKYFFQLNPHLKERRIVLFLGRIHTKKGCDLLIESFAKTLKMINSTPYHLMIAGPFEDDNYQKKILSLCQTLNLGPNDISFPGMIEGISKWQHLAAAEVFVLPSHQENFALAVSESLSCGTPVLLSNKVNIWRTIIEGEAGLVADDSLEGVQNLLTEWNDLSITQRKIFSQNALKVYTKEFSVEKIQHHFEDLIFSICNSK